ncbi:MAG TPA: hypothetical protein V6D19_05435 [Stenomitos sp.]
MTNTEVKAKYTYQPKQSANDWQMFLLSPRIVICYPNGDVESPKATARIGCKTTEEAYTLGKALVAKSFISRYEVINMKRDKLSEFVAMPKGVMGLRKGLVDLKAWEYNYSALTALAKKDWAKLFEDNISLKFAYQPDYAMCIINQWIGIWLEKSDANYLQSNWADFPQEDKINMVLTWEVLPQSMLNYLRGLLPEVVEVVDSDDCEF